MFSPHLKFSWKAHSAKILLREIFSREPFITWKFPDIQHESTARCLTVYPELIVGAYH